MKKLLTLAVPALVFVLAWATNVQADDTFCPTPPLTFEALVGVTVDDVIVTGGTCSLLGATVQGNVKVEAGGFLFADFNFATIPPTPTNIAGNVQADGADLIRLIRGTTVGGNVQVEETAGFPGAPLRLINDKKNRLETPEPSKASVSRG
ncbi:MAG: hypothetical protein V3W34_11235 [Phycisphaerae bacterium]|jgi:hypothetical protein